MFEKIKTELQTGNSPEVKYLVQDLLEKSVGPKEILEEGLVAGMDLIGAKFRKNEVFIPEVMIAAKAMHAGLEVLNPHLAKSGIKPAGKILIGTVKGDLHDIGKNIVGMMFRGAGFEVIDCGIDVAPSKLVETVESGDFDILAMSSLLTTSMPFMHETIKLLKLKGLDLKLRTIIGGAPITQGYANEIGANGYAGDASEAVGKVRELLGILKA